MPKDFDRCVEKKGKVRRVSGPNKEHGLKAGQFVNYCVLDGKSYRGHVHSTNGNAIRNG